MLRQDLESFDTTSKYAQSFTRDLKASFSKVHQRDINVEYKIIRTADQSPNKETPISKVKEEGEDGYEEQVILSKVKRSSANNLVGRSGSSVWISSLISS
jgi:predicted dithiol-disulfide oxidoreductase (DUF899 family)